MQQNFFSRHVANQFIRFATIGAIATTIDIVTTAVGVRVVGRPYLAGIIGMLVASVLNYALNRIWTFQSKDKRIIREGARFYTVLAISGTLHAIIYGALLPLFGFWLYAKLTTSAIIVFWHFLGHKLWTFRHSQSTSYNAQTSSSASVDKK